MTPRVDNNLDTGGIHNFSTVGFETVISDTEKQLVSSVKKPTLMDYLKKLGNKWWGVGLTATTLTLGSVAMNKNYNSRQSDDQIIQDKFHITVNDSVSTNSGDMVSQIVNQARQLTNEYDIPSYTDALPDHEKKSLHDFLAAMSVDTTLYMKNNDLFISPNNLKKILDENAQRWVIEHRESSQSSSVIWGLALLVGLLIVGNYVNKATKYEYQAAVQDVAKRAREIQKEYSKVQSINEVLVDILKANNALSGLTEQERKKQLTVAKNIKTMLVGPYFSSQEKPLIKGENRPDRPFPIQYSYDLITGLPDTILSERLRKTIKESNKMLATIKDTSQFTSQYAGIYSQYHEIMTMLQAELDAIIKNNDVISDWTINKATIISDLFEGEDVKQLQIQLGSVEDTISQSQDQLQKIQLENKTHSSLRHEEIDSEIARLTSRIEMDGIGSRELSGYSDDELQTQLDNLKDGADIVFNREDDEYKYTNIANYETSDESDKTNTDETLKKLNTIHWLLQRRQLDSDKGVVQATNDLKEKLRNLAIEKESLRRQIVQYDNPRLKAIAVTIHQTIDDVINGKVKIVGSSDQELLMNAYKYVIEKVAQQYKDLFIVNEDLSEQLNNQVNVVDKNFGIESLLFGAHRGASISGGYHATRQILNIQQIGDLFDNPTYYIMAGTVIAITAGLGVHKFISEVEKVADNYRTRSMDKKMPFAEIITHGNQGWKTNVPMLALFLGVAATTVADIGGSIATITSTHQKNEATAKVMDGNNTITRNINSFEEFIDTAKQTSLTQAKQTVVNEAKVGYAGILTGKKSAILFGNKEIVNDPVISVNESEFNSGYNNIPEGKRGQLEKVWANYEQQVDQIRSKKVMVNGESIVFRSLPGYIARQNTGLTNLNITQNIDRAKQLYQKELQKAVHAIVTETNELNKKLGVLEQDLREIGGASITFKKIDNEILTEKLQNIESQGSEVSDSLEDMNVYYNLLTKEGIEKTIDALKKNAHDPKMRGWILFISLAALHLTGAIWSRSRKTVDQKMKSPHTDTIYQKGIEDLMYYAHLASQESNNLQGTYEAIVETIKDEKNTNEMINKYLLQSGSTEQTIQKIKTIVGKNKDRIDADMGYLYNDALLGEGTKVPKKEKYSTWLEHLIWLDPRKTEIIFSDLFIRSETFRNQILKTYLDDENLDIANLVVR